MRFFIMFIQYILALHVNLIILRNFFNYVYILALHVKLIILQNKLQIGFMIQYNVVAVTIDRINQQQKEYPKQDNKQRTFGRYCPHIEIQNNEKTTNDDHISPLNLILTLHNTVEYTLYRNKSCEILFHWFKCVC